MQRQESGWVCLATFSILGRIEPTATPFASVAMAADKSAFQYPRSDRAHCNADLSYSLFEATKRLSVSSVGSSPLQQDEASVGAVPSAVGLSVSSVGSSPLQLRVTWASWDPGPNFQYPRSDRAHCNGVDGDGCGLAAMNFQYPRSDRAHCNSGWSERRGGSICLFQYPRSDRAHCNAARSSARGGRQRPFQYPRSDRAHCNHPPAQANQVHHFFQYPRSDRAHCNRSRRRGSTGGALAFSILGRIEPTATTTPFLRWPWTQRAFSILGRIEPTATLLVPTGTHAVQPGFQYPRSDRAHCNVWHDSHHSGRQNFQYPRSDRAHCNADGPPKEMRAWIFQYPRSDRAHCNPLASLERVGPIPLSVSSVGSSPLQPQKPVGGFDSHPTFSILGRIEPTATTPVRVHALEPQLTFSILGRIEPTATAEEATDVRVVLSVFQYPRSDRAHCNPRRRRPSRPLACPFQYPRSDRAHCNNGLSGLTQNLSRLSVSSVGSSPLQRSRYA